MKSSRSVTAPARNLRRLAAGGIPTIPNLGRVDRRSLSAPDLSRVVVRGYFAAALCLTLGAGVALTFGRLLQGRHHIGARLVRLNEALRQVGLSGELAERTNLRLLRKNLLANLGFGLRHGPVAFGF